MSSQSHQKMIRRPFSQGHFPTVFVGPNRLFQSKENCLVDQLSRNVTAKCWMRQNCEACLPHCIQIPGHLVTNIRTAKHREMLCCFLDTSSLWGHADMVFLHDGNYTVNYSLIYLRDTNSIYADQKFTSTLLAV